MTIPSRFISSFSRPRFQCRVSTFDDSKIPSGWTEPRFDALLETKSTHLLNKFLFLAAQKGVRREKEGEEDTKNVWEWGGEDRRLEEIAEISAGEEKRRQQEGVGRKLDVKSSKRVQQGTFSVKIAKKRKKKWLTDKEVEA